MADQAAKDYFEHIKNEYFMLKVEWRLYRSFFGTNRETVDMLNSISGPTVSTLERVLFERTLLGLRKLTDPFVGRRGRTKSVTIKGLSAIFIDESKELKQIVGEAERSTAFARNWSDKRIAHSDLEYRSGREKLASATRAKIEEALERIGIAVQWISVRHFDTTLGVNPIPPMDDEREFLRVLYLGYQAATKQVAERELFIAAKDYKKASQLMEEIFDVPEWLNRADPPLL